jgi:hypothetical protein
MDDCIRRAKMVPIIGDQATLKGGVSSRVETNNSNVLEDSESGGASCFHPRMGGLAR